MNKQNNIYFLVIALIFASCGKKEKNTLLFSNSIESIYCWGVEPTSHIIKSDQAHSGIYMSKIDSIWAYSTTFRMKVKDISKSTLKKVKYSAWIMLEDLEASPFLVAEFRDKDNKVTDWLSYNVLNELSEEGKWVEISATADLTQNNRNDGETEIRVYVSNGKNVPAYVDDFEVEFFE